MIRGPKEKKERSLGERLGLKGERCRSPKCAMVRRPYPPGVHARKRGRKSMSDFGRQLREKQKVKVSYGLDERALGSLYRRAEKYTGSTAARLLELLESRLDNVLYGLGFAPSRAMARQLVRHGHIFVDNTRVRSPGYHVAPGARVRIRLESRSIGPFRELKERLKTYTPPPWLALDPENLEGKIIAVPNDPSLVPFEITTLVESFNK